MPKTEGELKLVAKLIRARVPVDPKRLADETRELPTVAEDPS